MSSSILTPIAPVLHNSSTTSTTLSDPDIIIVGFGLAGSALATTLARAGRNILIIERDELVPDSIRGELLQPGGVRVLERLQLCSTLKVPAVDATPVRGYALLSPPTSGKPDVLLSYPAKDPSHIATWLGFGLEDKVKPPALPDRTTAPTGRSFQNSRFVEALRALAIEAGVRVEWGSVRNIALKDGRITGVQWLERGGGALRTSRAPLIVAADGMYSMLRGRLEGGEPETVSAFAGLLLSHPPNASPLPHEHRGHVILASPNPVLFYQIGTSCTRVLVDLPLSVYAAHGKDSGIKEGALASYLIDVIAPQLPSTLRDVFEKAAATQEAELMPCKALPTSSHNNTGRALRGGVLLGDARSMRHPLTGGGMTVALRDVELLAEALHGVALDDDLHALDHAIHMFALARKPHSTTINVLANALHAVFSVPPLNTRGYASAVALRDACLAYLSLGGAASAGPIGLLAGLTPHPLVLLIHFIAVAFYAVSREFTHKRISLQSPYRAIALVFAATSIIIPIAYKEGLLSAVYSTCPRRSRTPFTVLATLATSIALGLLFF